MQQDEANIFEEEFKDLENLTVKELKERSNKIVIDLREYQRISELRREAIIMVMRAKRTIEIYKRDGLKGVYKYFDFYRRYPCNKERSYWEGDVPF